MLFPTASQHMTPSPAITPIPNLGHTFLTHCRGLGSYLEKRNQVKNI